ncbi:hypothetical protein K438DRAFT_1978441 [Mycena galopus ATCC 62051]|nr:hypothetical protein K438DRAFT_1978441 [Mycena galopus ATCC 62051]
MVPRKQMINRVAPLLAVGAVAQRHTGLARLRVELHEVQWAVDRVHPPPLSPTQPAAASLQHVPVCPIRSDGRAGGKSTCVSHTLPLMLILASLYSCTGLEKSCFNMPPVESSKNIVTSNCRWVYSMYTTHAHSGSAEDESVAELINVQSMHSNSHTPTESGEASHRLKPTNAPVMPASCAPTPMSTKTKCAKRPVSTVLRDMCTTVTPCYLIMLALMRLIALHLDSVAPPASCSGA